jgi:Predicted hydrolases or acyltransferases (alpha/beta hydrolase superfamily)
MGLADRNFEMIHTNGVNLRCVVEGEGPLIILMHGWPQCWYLWRHQIDPLIEQGWKVCVPDQRGYGMSDCPPHVEDYKIKTLCADIDGLATALGYDEYALMIHDWGAIAGWNVALLYPDRVRAVVGLSVPYARWTMPEWCTQEYWGDQFFYWAHFCEEEGLAERLLEEDIRLSLKTMHIHTSGDRGKGATPKQEGVRSLLEAVTVPPDELPPWMTEEDLDYYVRCTRSHDLEAESIGTETYRPCTPTLGNSTTRKLLNQSFSVQGSERRRSKHMIVRESQLEILRSTVRTNVP